MDNHKVGDLLILEDRNKNIVLGIIKDVDEDNFYKIEWYMDGTPYRWVMPFEVDFYRKNYLEYMQEQGAKYGIS